MKWFVFRAALFGAMLAGLVSCGTEHLVSDAEERRVMLEDFERRRADVPRSEVFDFDLLPMSDLEREAMKFLYAYMPMSDVVDYDPEFFLRNVRASFVAREEMPWGERVPEREFRHFVLPVRVNNEDVDSARWVFYGELKDRVRGLSMRDAVLEVNHWCHEKVVYTPADPRTSSPLATMRTAYGRCGEESTFAVAALRSVGIPARQVYTPRWAHTDNNHAWVEAWVDGEWMFLGACEPEPVLNLGWFNAPASRSMLMHTKVFGRYAGSEEVMRQTPLFTEINVIDNYAPSARVDVSVVRTDGEPASGATVEFRLYNYAEFYAIATKRADEHGRTFLTAGLGDLVVWAREGGRYGFKKVSFGKDSSVEVVLDRKVGDEYGVVLDIVPPAEGVNMPEVTAEQRAENSRRLAYEDSVRGVYVGTFYTEAMAREFAAQYGYTAAEDVVVRFLTESRGNHEVITTFLAEMAERDSRDVAVDLLDVLLAKDLRDVRLEVLRDNAMPTPAGMDAEVYKNYVRCPRAGFELLTPYKQFFVEAMNSDSARAYREDPMRLVRMVQRTVRVDNECNMGGAPISPAGVWRAWIADERSRDIYFVALARALDIPARIDPVTGKVQLMGGVAPQDVDFGETVHVSAPTGTLKAGYAGSAVLDDPKYYNHFTISRVTDEGSLALLSYDEGESGMEQGVSWSGMLRDGMSLDAGNYLLVTGTRLANGGVLATAKSLVIRAGETTVVDLDIRHSHQDVEVIGEFNSESMFRPVGGTEPKSILATTGRGYFVVAVLGVNQEPTNHAMRDMAAMASELETWGREMVLLFPSEEDYRKFNPSEFGAALPKNITYGIDADGSIEGQIIEAMKLRRQNHLPVFIIADTFNRVVFCSQGYNINLGEQLLNTIKKL